MGDDWCPVGGRCAQPGCWVDVHNRCEVHNCPMISKEVLGLIRQELRNAHMSAVKNWKARVAELTAQSGRIAEHRDLIDSQRKRVDARVVVLDAALTTARDEREGYRQHLLASRVVIEQKTTRVAELESGIRDRLTELGRAQKYLDGLPEHADVGDDCTAELAVRVTELELTISGKTFYDPTDARVAEMEGERNNARALARVLAHAYETDTRPPPHMVTEALEFSVDQRGKGQS